MILLLDMDCVLADWVEGVANVYDLTFADMQPHWPPGEYGIHTVLSKILEQQVTEQDLWFKLDNLSAFWFDLKPTPWLDYLLQLARHFDEWYIVSDPNDRDHVILEKRHWLRKYLGRTDHLIPTQYKHLLARPNAILIDDNVQHCDKFCGEGGRAFLFPAWHNPRYEHYGDPILLLEKKLCTFKQLM